MIDPFRAATSFSIASGEMPTDLAAARSSRGESFISLTADTIPEKAIFFKYIGLWYNKKSPTIAGDGN
jgi:hypothetical protein